MSLNGIVYVRVLALVALWPGLLGCQDASTEAGPPSEDVQSEADALTPDVPTEPPDTKPQPDTPTIDASSDTDINIVPDPAPTLLDPAACEAPKLTVTTILAAPVTGALPLPEGAVIAQTAEGLLRVDEPEGDPVVLEGGPSMLDRIAVLDDGTVLLLGDGIWIPQDEGFLVSPLTETFNEVTISALVAPSGTGDLWFGTSTGLHLLREGVLYPVEFTELELEGILLTYGALWEDEPTLWVVTDNDVYALVESADGIELWLERSDLVPEATVVDGNGQLWVSSGGDVHMRGDEGWEWYRAPVVLGPVHAHPEAPDAWFPVVGGAWHHVGSAFCPIELDSAYELLSVDEKGRALVSADGALLRLAVDAPLGPEPDPPNWADEVSPLAIEHCGQCHGDGKFAHPMHTREHWITEMDDILLVVNSKAMPLPPNEPLDKKAIAIIEDWKEAGFPE